MTNVVFKLIVGRGIGGQAVEPAFLLLGGGPGRLFGSVFYATGANGLIGNRVGPDIAGTAGQRHCHRTEELPRPLHGFLQVGQAPTTDHTWHLRRARRRIVHRLQVVVGAATGQRANRRVRAIRCLQAGGGQQHVPRLAGRHIGEALHHQRQGPGNARRGGRGAVGIRDNFALGAGGRDARHAHHAPPLGGTATVVDLGAGLVVAGDGEELSFDIRLEKRQVRIGVRVGTVAVVARRDDLDERVLPGRIGHGVHPGFVPGMGLVPERAIGGGHVLQVLRGAVADVAEVVLHVIARALPPTLVDDRHVLRRQGVVAGHECVVVEVVGALVAVVVAAASVGDKKIGVEGNAVHTSAVAVGSQHPGHFRAMPVVELRVVFPRDTERLPLLELAAGYFKAVARMGGVVLARGGHRLHPVLALSVLALELGVFGEDARVQHANIDPLASDAQGIGVIRVGAVQAGVDLGFRGLPGLRVGAPVTGCPSPGLACVQLPAEVAANARLDVSVRLGGRQVGDNGFGKVEDIGGVTAAVAEQPAAVVIQARGIVQWPPGVAEHGADGQVFGL